MPVQLRQCCSLIIVAGGDVVVMCAEVVANEEIEVWKVQKGVGCGKQTLNRF